MKKPPFGQLKGTVAYKYKHRAALGGTIVILGMGWMFHCFYSQFAPLPSPRLMGPDNYEKTLYHRIRKRPTPGTVIEEE